MRMQRIRQKSLQGLGIQWLDPTAPDYGANFLSPTQSYSTYAQKQANFQNAMYSGGSILPSVPTIPYEPPPPPAPAPTNINVQTAVNPAISTQVSPQISPVFQQSYMPSGSPMTAGTAQVTAPPPPPPPPPPPTVTTFQPQQQQPASLTYTTTETTPQAPPPQQPSQQSFSYAPVDGSGTMPPMPASAAANEGPTGFTQSPYFIPLMIAGGVGILALVLATRR